MFVLWIISYSFQEERYQLYFITINAKISKYFKRMISLRYNYYLNLKIIVIFAKISKKE
jgi:hypothetical protein